MQGNRINEERIVYDTRWRGLDEFVGLLDGNVYHLHVSLSIMYMKSVLLHISLGSARVIILCKLVFARRSEVTVQNIYRRSDTVGD